GCTTWKARPRPRWQRWNEGSLVMSVPSSSMVPVLGSNSPERRFKVVVLPAPLGPMIAKISPRSTSNERPPTAARPPKLRPRSVALRSGSATCRLLSALARQSPEEPDDAAWHEQNRDDQHHAVGHQVAVGQHPLEGLLEAREDQGGQD